VPERPFDLSFKEKPLDDRSHRVISFFLLKSDGIINIKLVAVECGEHKEVGMAREGIDVYP